MVRYSNGKANRNVRCYNLDSWDSSPGPPLRPGPAPPQAARPAFRNPAHAPSPPLAGCRAHPALRGPRPILPGAWPAGAGDRPLPARRRVRHIRARPRAGVGKGARHTGGGGGEPPRRQQPDRHGPDRPGPARRLHPVLRPLALDHHALPGPVAPRRLHPRQLHPAGDARDRPRQHHRPRRQPAAQPGRPGGQGAAPPWRAAGLGPRHPELGAPGEPFAPARPMASR